MLLSYLIPNLFNFSNMKTMMICILGLSSFEFVSAQQKDLVVRVATLQVDSTQLESYRVALREGIETAIRVEPGVLTLYAVSDKKNPTHITVFEIYANDAAYKAHLETPHFKKYKNFTKSMVKSLEFMETSPIVLRAKEK
jgi:quinol monooxygenase YgiN